MAIASQDFKEKHKKAVWTARITYAVIMLSFISIITFAVTTVMQMEKNKTGFKAIKVTQPISFFDNTYVDDKPKSAAEQGTPKPE